MKSLNLLFLSFLLLFLLSGESVAQLKFPARGFSPILSNDQAVEKLEIFKKVFFPIIKKAVPHRAYLYSFSFIHYEGNQKGKVYHGLISGPSVQSSLVRIDLFSDPQRNVRMTSFLLKRDIRVPEAWKWQKGGSSVESIPAKLWLSPWVNGINHSPFDILMPFIRWPFVYEKSGRVCGRPSHLFSFSSSLKGNQFGAEISTVRLTLDDAYGAPLRIEHFDGGILPARTFSLQSFKKIGNQWVVKGIDAKHRDSRSRTRYEINEIAHDLDFPANSFHQDGLLLPLPASSIKLDPI